MEGAYTSRCNAEQAQPSHAAAPLPHAPARRQRLRRPAHPDITGVLAALVLAMPFSAHAYEIVVSAGSAAGLQSAILEVEALSARSWPSEGVTVRLLAGVYRLESPLKIGRRARGRPNAPLTFAGPSLGSAVLTGSRQVTGFTSLPADKALRLPQSVRSQLRFADLRRLGITDFGSFTRQGQGRSINAAPLELFYRGRPMPIAQWPNGHYVLIASTPEGKRGTVMVLSEERTDSWSQEPDLWMTGYWGEDWADEWIRIATIDAAAKTLHVSGDPPLYGMAAGQRVRVVNALSELDVPGEWYLDRDTGTLYFWPPAPLGDTDIEVSVLRSVVDIEGASHVRLEGLTFEGARGDAIVVRGGRDVRVERSVIRNVGSRAVVMNGVEHQVLDCDIYDTGQGGIYLFGGDRSTLLPGELLAQGNRIHRFNRWVKTYRPAIFLSGVGNGARQNLIFDGPHTGLLFYGNEHLIELNDLHTLALETGDVGAIYTGKDWTARGTVIRSNYLHDIRGPGKHGSRGIYLDDQASGTVVQGNLFFRVNAPLFIGGGRDNVADNNLFVQSSPAIHLDARGRTWQRTETDDPAGLLRRRLSEVPYQSGPFADRYPTLPGLLEQSPGSPIGNVVRRNGVVSGVPFELKDGVERELVIDRIFDDSSFVFSATTPLERKQFPEEFSLHRSSTALRAGFSPLALDRMGCTARRWSRIPSARVPSAGELVSCD
jgi:hypothetical protein